MKLIYEQLTNQLTKQATQLKTHKLKKKLCSLDKSYSLRIAINNVIVTL